MVRLIDLLGIRGSGVRTPVSPEATGTEEKVKQSAIPVSRPVPVEEPSDLSEEAEPVISQSDTVSSEDEPAALTRPAVPVEPEPVPIREPEKKLPPVRSIDHASATAAKPAGRFQPERKPARLVEKNRGNAVPFGKAYSEEIEKSYREANAVGDALLNVLDDIYREAGNGGPVKVDRLVQPLIGLIRVCLKSNVLLRKAVQLKKEPESFAAHCLNAAIMAVKIGAARKFSGERLFSLALIALLGDIGMTKVDPTLIGKKGKLTGSELRKIREHVEVSKEIVSEVSDRFPFLPILVYQHHERENGSGYPKGLKGEDIHEFAKIISLSDVFIAMTSPRGHREDFSGYVTLQQIIARRGD